MNDEETLKGNIDEAILALAPKFGVSPETLATFRSPTVLVCDVIETRTEPRIPIRSDGMYIFDEARFKLTRHALNDLLLLGHEVSHYLHNEINPQFRQRMKDYGGEDPEFWIGFELQELVGEYGGIIYTTSQGVGSSARSRGLYCDNGVPGLIARLSDCAHDLAARRADKAFSEHGEELLPRLSRLGLDEADEILFRLLPVTFYEKRILPVLDRLRRKGQK
jgi:hypothetical protein